MRGFIAASGATYEVDDLVCLLCSTMHGEAALTISLPDVATPDSIELGLGALPSASLPKSTRILTRSQPLTRIWRKTRPSASMSSMLVSVLHELIGCVYSFGAASFFHSSRALHGGGLYMAQPAIL